MNLVRASRSRGSGSPPGISLFSALGLIAGDPFTVASGATVIIDIDTPSLGYTDIAGTVRTDGTARTLTTTGINIASGGVLQLGTAAVPLTALTTISLTGAYVPLTMTTVNGFATPTNPGTSRGIMVQPGGTLDLHGTPPSTLWTTLNANASNGATSLTLATSPGWASGDAVVIANTEFPSTYISPANPGQPGHTTQQFTLSGATSGTAATLSAGLVSDHWGVLQYPVDTLVSGSGMALTQNTFSTKKAHANVPIVLDERARVANLTRNIVISCPADTDWTNKGHGVHIMWMASGATLPLVRIEGVQIRRGGQRGALGRYPFHAHMNSYTAATGAFTADTPLNYVKKCVVWESENRAYTIHGTCGMEMTDNIGYYIRGHAFFLEDGSERRNNIRRNSMFGVYAPHTGLDNELSTSLRGDVINSGSGFSSMSGSAGLVTVNWTSHGLYSGEVVTASSASNSAFNAYRTPCTVTSANQFTYASAGVSGSATATFRKDNDTIKDHDWAASGYWLTNLDNYFEDNYASDCFAGDLNQQDVASSGVWISLATSCVGASALVAINPNAIDTLLLKGFVSHSNYGRGMTLGFPVSDELGTFTALGASKYSPVSGGFSSTDHVIWKNNVGAYFNSVQIPTYQRWTTADNGQSDFFGSTNNGGLSSQHLLIGASLNNAYTTPAPQAVYPRAAFVSYHGTVRFFDMTAVNFPYAAFVYRSALDRGSAGGVAQGFSDSYDCPGIDLTQGLNSNIQLINSHYGEMCPPIHLDGRADGGRHYSVAGALCDTDGKYGTAGKWQIPYTRVSGVMTSVDNYYLTGATNVADGPTSGTVVCKTTDTKFIGTGWSDACNINSDTLLTNHSGFFAGSPVTVTRQTPGTTTTIGTPILIKDGFTGSAFTGYHAWAMMTGGQFKIDFNDGVDSVSPAASYFIMELVNANTTGDYLLLGIPWAAASVPRVCFGSHFSNESMSTLETGTQTGARTQNTFASAADVTAKRAVIAATSGANLAAVVADTAGTTYWRDTANNRIWVRYTLPSGATYSANPTLIGGFGSLYDIQYVVVKV